MCRVKGCARPPFVGGLCGLHAMERAWPGRRVPAALAPRDPRPRRTPRREKAPPASG